MGFQKILLKDKISFTHPPQCASEKRPYFKEVTVFLRSSLSLWRRFCNVFYQGPLNCPFKLFDQLAYIWFELCAQVTLKQTVQM